MSIDQLVLHLPKGCSLWNIQTSSLGQHYLLVTPTQQRFQVSAKASDIIEELLDEQKSVSALAASLSAKWKMQLSPEDVLAILDSVHWPKGLVARFYPSELTQIPEDNIEERKRPTPLFGSFFFRATIIPACVVDTLARKLVWLYTWPVAIVGLLLAFFAQFQIFHQAIWGNAWRHSLLLSPAQYLLAFVLMALAVVGHELGHATAAKRCGVNPGEIGFGLYLIYPALYTELGFAWLLPSVQRVLVDLGGFYFQLLATIVLYLGYLLTHSNAIVVTVLTLDFLLVFSLMPFFKFDGYWLVADVLGVPNLQKRSMEALASPLRVLKSPVFVSQSGMVLPRRIAIALFVYGCFFVPFQIFFAIMVFKNGVPTLVSAPSAVYHLLGIVAASLGSGHTAQGLYALLRMVMVLVMDLSLILILRAYMKAAAPLWKFCMSAVRANRKTTSVLQLKGAQNDPSSDL